MDNNLINLVNAESISHNEQQWSGPFTFVQAADTQFGLIDRYLLNIDDFNWDKEKALCRESIRRINEMQPKPKFYIICGDMLDAFPYEGRVEISDFENNLNSRIRCVDNHQSRTVRRLCEDIQKFRSRHQTGMRLWQSRYRRCTNAGGS